MENYKENIAATRVGCLGSSDGRILAQIASTGEVPKSAYKRMAIVKGLIPQTEIPATPAILAGDRLEMMVYEHIKKQDERYESNPLWVSEKYSKKNVKLISHPDIVLIDDANKTINVYEVKTTKFSVVVTQDTYKAQLYIHYVIAKEMATNFGSGWKVRLFLVHYSTEGLDLTNGIEFDPDRLTIKRVQFSSSFFNVNMAMDIANNFLETFTEYYDGDEIDADLLPVVVKDMFDDITKALVEIKEREEKVANFKKTLYQFMVDKNIKSIKNFDFSVTRVDPTIKKSFDSKRFINDMAKEHPRKAKKIAEKYSKETNCSGYALIKIKND